MRKCKEKDLLDKIVDIPIEVEAEEVIETTASPIPQLQDAVIPVSKEVLQTFTNQQATEIVKENEKRREIFDNEADQISGRGCTSVERQRVFIEELGGELYLPKAMLEENPFILDMDKCGSLKEYLSSIGEKTTKSMVTKLADELIELRFHYDFEFWAIVCTKIKNKLGGDDIPFKLNVPQRLFLTELERQRLNDEPIRIILLKSRQWGGSTLTQIYMAWIQLIHKKGWNSVIAAHQKDGSANIKEMYHKLLENYPTQLLGKIRFTPVQRMQNCSKIEQRNCRVTIGTSERPDSVRGQDISMAHLSEVAFWQDTKEKKATDLIRSIASSIPLTPLSLLVIESTANGVGDYFHTEWLRCNMDLEDERGDKHPIFIPWFIDPKNQLPIKDKKAFVFSMSPDDVRMWNRGACLEAIRWYRAKRKEYIDIQDMQSEYPSTPEEAFKNSGKRVFAEEHISAMRKAYLCKPKMIGEVISTNNTMAGEGCLVGLSFATMTTGKMKVWELPQKGSIDQRYVVAVDAGGRSDKADWSVICVIDREGMLSGGVPEVVAQWRGHIDLDLLAWKACQIAEFYDHAVLVIESNTFETHETEGEHGEFILDTISNYYSNLYYRIDETKMRQGLPMRYGFHTNRATKTTIINNMIALMRTGGYIEHDDTTLNEFDVYEIKDNGSFGAIDGKHDDCLMTRCIGMYVAYSIQARQAVKKFSYRHQHKKYIGMSSF